MKYNEIPTSEQLLLELTMPMGCNYYNLVKYAVCGEL